MSPSSSCSRPRTSEDHALVVGLVVLCCWLPIVICGPAADHRTLCSPVYITVSALNDHPGKLELNWDLRCAEKPDWVGLFEVDPTVIKTATPLVKVNVDSHPWNYFRTEVSLEYSKLPGGWEKDAEMSEYSVIPGPHCLPFWIASFKDNILQNTNCLKIQPTWMYDKLNQLSGIPLSKLIIPGTHNSGSYNSDDSVLKGEGFHRFVFTQDHDIWTQLVFGIRYLDFRIGYYQPSEGSTSTSDEKLIQDDRFWINHDLVKITALVPLLRDIKKFLDFTKKEIVILDIHRLPVGFYFDDEIRRKRHEMLVNLIFRELYEYAVDFAEVSVPHSKANIHLLDGPRVKDIWDTGKRLIICYPEESITKGATWLWPRLRQMWGDKQTPSALKNYIQNILTQPQPPTIPQGNPMWAVMAQLTPSAIDIIFNPRNNLRKMADSINRNLTEWVKNDWWKKANIIATDFYMGNNLIEVAINSVMLKTTYLGSD